MIFVNYAHFYVNIVMSTPATTRHFAFIIFNYCSISWDFAVDQSLNIGFAS